MILYGVHAVESALRAGVRGVAFVKVGRKNPRVEGIRNLAREQGVSLREADDAELTREAGTSDHQGVVAQAGALPEYELADLLEAAPRPKLAVVLDQVQDPRNLGAILRTMAGFGWYWVVLPKDHCAPLGGVTAKAAAGALEVVRVVRVANVAQSLRTLQDHFWVWGAAGEGEREITGLDLEGNHVLVLGQEERGLRPLVRKQCHGLVRIGMPGPVPSLNISVAAGIFLHYFRGGLENEPARPLTREGRGI